MNRPLVRAYDPAWRDWFAALRVHLAPCLAAGAADIEHVGSTAVPGLAAKPIIDIDIVIEPGRFEPVREALDRLGYTHVGDQGIPEREVFKPASAEAVAGLPPHHLYVCEEDAPPLHSHRTFRDFLRARPARVEALSKRKIEAAERADHDRDVYMDLKAPAYARIIAEALLLETD